MKDHRRDHTAEIPASTLEELRASQQKLAKRDVTLMGIAGPEEPSPASPAERVVCRPPMNPIRRDELEAALGEQLKLFPPGCREGCLRSFSVRSYVVGTTLLDEAVKLQPKNLTMAKAASAVRHFALARLEVELGALHATVRTLKALPAEDATSQAREMLLHVDGKTSIEGLLRKSKLDRLAALNVLADLARSEHIELLAPSASPDVTMRLPPIPSGTHALVEEIRKGDPPPERESRRPRPMASQPPLIGVSERAIELERPPASAEPLAAEESQCALGGGSEPMLELEGVNADPPPATKSSTYSRNDSDRVRFDAPPSVAPPPPHAEVAPAQQPVSARPLSSPRLATPLAMAAVSPQRERRSARTFAIAGVAVALGIALVFVLLSSPTPESTTLGAAAPVQARSPSQIGADRTAAVPPLVSAPSAAASVTVATERSGAMETIVVRIKADPLYARVFLDGILLTKTPIEVTIPKDEQQHEVNVEAPGFRSKKMNFVADANVSIIAALDRLASNKRSPGVSGSASTLASPSASATLGTGQ